MIHRTDRAARIAVALIGLAGTAAACVQAPQGPTYAAIVVTQSNNEYRAALGLTAQECGKRMADMPAGDWYCEREER